MSDRSKDKLLKILLLVGVILMLMVFPGSIFISLLIPNPKTFETIFYAILISTFIVGMLFMILLPILGGLKLKPVQAERRPFLFDSYAEFMTYTQESLDKKSYSKQPALSITTGGEVTLYAKPSGLWILNCFVIVRVPELSSEILEDANNAISDILYKYYHCKRISDTVNVISVFCVDRITPTFQKLVNSPVQQGFKNGRLPVGISLGGKSIYIAKQKDEIGIARYKRLRNEFINILNLF